MLSPSSSALFPLFISASSCRASEAACRVPWGGRECIQLPMPVTLQHWGPFHSLLPLPVQRDSQRETARESFTVRGTALNSAFFFFFFCSLRESAAMQSRTSFFLFEQGQLREMSCICGDDEKGSSRAGTKSRLPTVVDTGMAKLKPALYRLLLPFIWPTLFFV